MLKKIEQFQIEREIFFFARNDEFGSDRHWGHGNCGREGPDQTVRRLLPPSFGGLECDNDTIFHLQHGALPFSLPPWEIRSFGGLDFGRLH